MQTVRQFTSRLWYVTPIIIVPYNHVPITYPTIDNFRDISIYDGSVNGLRSINYDDINNKYVKGYGVIDNTLIIEVLED